MKKIGVVIHGVTGRMGDMARRSLAEIAARGGFEAGGEMWAPVPIGLGRESSRLEAYAQETGLEHYATEPLAAIELARRIDPDRQVYHCCISTGAKHGVLEELLGRLDPRTTAVFQEKPLAGNYGEGFDVVELLDRRRFKDGVVHDFLEAPGIRRAIELMPEVKPLSAQMLFGYEAGAGYSGNPDFAGQRPDFNWTFAEAGGGIILDMSHESYISRALFGPTHSLSCVGRLLVPRRRSTVTGKDIECDVEDYASIRRVHASGVVNNSTWSWFRRINSELGPLEISVEGENASLVFGLYGIKVQWKESAPAVRWKDALAGKSVPWRDYWQSVPLSMANPFAAELEAFLRSFVTGAPYPLNAVAALNILGEVEGLYRSAAGGGEIVLAANLYRYPARVPRGWTPERLQGRVGRIQAGGKTNVCD
jgi:predicted dehydrogenase